MPRQHIRLSIFTSSTAVARTYTAMLDGHGGQVRNQIVLLVYQRQPSRGPYLRCRPCCRVESPRHAKVHCTQSRTLTSELRELSDHDLTLCATCCPSPCRITASGSPSGGCGPLRSAVASSVSSPQK